MRKQRTIFLFAAASLLPAACLLAGALLGGAWPLAALLSVTLLVLIADRIGFDFEASARPSDTLPFAVGFAHFAVLATTLWAMGQTGTLDWGQKLILGLAMGLYAGQVSNSCAHELIHRSDRAARWLGTAIYCSILNGQHVSAHLLVHHVYAGTSKDPCSAPSGRGFYRFYLTAMRDEFLSGLRAETARRKRYAKGLHPYATYVLAGLFSLLVAWLLGGLVATVALLLIGAHAQSQLLLSDYVQHYGLRRGLGPAGKIAPMGPQHSWNAPQPYSAAMMLNAPRHSDHHMRPALSFCELELRPDVMPTLPYSLPVMGAIALVPPLWRRLMDPRVSVWMGTADPTGHREGVRYSGSLATK